MELDKRIKDITDIKSVTDGCHDWEFMTKKGYFANSILDFKDLKCTCMYGEYAGWRVHDQCFLCEQAGDKTYYSYFLPENILKPVGKKYRPYSIKDFRKAFINEKFDVFIILRDKHNPDDICTMRYNGSFRKGQFEYICLDTKIFSFESMFEYYEWKDSNGNWQPFGTEVKEK